MIPPGSVSLQAPRSRIGYSHQVTWRERHCAPNLSLKYAGQTAAATTRPGNYATVWWSAHASSSLCANCSTGSRRFGPQTMKPAVAAQTPPNSKKNFFIHPPRYVPTTAAWAADHRYAACSTPTVPVGCSGAPSGWDGGPKPSAKLIRMDPTRFGRVLGVGARLAAKTAVTAVDAALAPNPATTSAAQPRPTKATSPGAAATRGARTSGQPSSPPQSSTRSQPRPSSARPHARRLTGALIAPVRRLSSVLWLEFTGVFFGLFAAAAALGAWRLRSAWRPTPANATDHAHLLLTFAVALLFAYFCTTSFLRARRRSRQP